MDDQLDQGRTRLPSPSPAGKDLGRCRPSRWPTSATCRWPTRPASPPPATRSCAIRGLAAELHRRAATSSAVITNGTAVLGLGDIGAARRQAGDGGQGRACSRSSPASTCFDIEIAESDPDKLVDIIAALEPTFGGINLEDIKAPECFYVEQKLRERMKIPVFHDDQHGTAIIVGAAVLNGLQAGRQGHRARSKLVVLRRRRRGARLPRPAGRRSGCARENICVTDIKGVVYAGPHRADGRQTRRATRATTQARTLAEIIAGADVFLGLSAARRAEARDGREDGRPADDPRAGQSRAGDPAGSWRKAVRPDCIIATGRSDYPEPGQQRPVLPLHLPRRARRRRDDDQRGDEARLRARDRRARAGRAVRRGRARLRRAATVASAPTT